MIIPPQTAYPIVRKDATAESQMEGWMREVSDRVNAMEIQDGTDTPNGNVFASAKTFYLDTALGELWFKTTDETLDTGWVQLG
jgi:hypothetical protein